MAQSPATQSPATQSPEAQSPPAQNPEARNPEARNPEARSPEARSPEARSRWCRAPLLLGVASVVLGGFAVWSGIKAHDLHDQQAQRNVALTDAAATSQVQRQLGRAIDTIFSYNYADTGKTRTAAQRLLTGPAIKQYDSLFKLVQQDAPAQRLVLTTQVTSSGVEMLIGDRARLLVFADQRDTRMTTHQTSYAGALFAVNAIRAGGRWKIDSIDTFTGTT